MNEAGKERMLVRQGRGPVAEKLQHVAGAVKGERNQATCDRRPYWVKLIFERRCNTEVSAATSHGPEEIGIFLLARVQYLTLGRDDLHGAKVVEREPVFAHE